jgi:hypothetical protein
MENDKYQKMLDDKMLSDFYSYMENELQFLTEHILKSPQFKGFLPALSTKSLSNENYIKSFIEQEDAHVDLNGNKVLTVPFPFLGYLNAERTMIFPHKLTDETKDEYKLRAVKIINNDYHTNYKEFDDIVEANKLIRENNIANHKKNLNTDLAFSMPLFIESALNHKYKNDIKAVVMNALDSLKDVNTNRAVTFGADYSNSYKHFAKMLEMDYYERFTKKSIINGTGRRLKAIASLNYIGFNVTAGAKNIAYGMSVMEQEAMAGINFNHADLAFGTKYYAENINAFKVDEDTTRASSKASGMVKMFNVIEDINDLMEKSSPELHTKKPRKWFYKGAYWMQATGEHIMHNTAMFAMANSHRIIDGKIMNLSEFSRSKFKTATIHTTAAELEQLKRENSKNKEQLKIEFETYPKVIDSIELATDKKGNSLGYTKFKDDSGVTDTEFIFFKEKIKRVNHQLHGIYNKPDKGTFENYMLGQLVMHFYHWLRPGIVKRFGKTNPLLDKPQWNEARNSYEHGDYIVPLTMLIRPVRQFYKANVGVEMEEKFITKEALKAMYHGTALSLTKLSLVYNMLSMTEKAAMNRAITEQISRLMLISVLTLSAALMAPDDDDDKQRKKDISKGKIPDKLNGLIPNTAFNVLEGLYDELNTYSPTGAYKNVKNKHDNLIGASGMIYGVAESIYLLGNDLVSDDEAGKFYQGGKYIFERKSKVKIYQQLPFMSQLQKITHLDAANQLYKFKNYNDDEDSTSDKKKFKDKQKRWKKRKNKLKRNGDYDSIFPF